MLFLKISSIVVWKLELSFYNSVSWIFSFWIISRFSQALVSSQVCWPVNSSGFLYSIVALPARPRILASRFCSLLSVNIISVFIFNFEGWMFWQTVLLGVYFRGKSLFTRIIVTTIIFIIRMIATTFSFKLFIIVANFFFAAFKIILFYFC